MGYWDRARPVLRKRALDAAALADGAAALLDGGGTTALTVRALADRLGVAPASLYSRIESVDDLVDLALDHALARDIGDPDSYGTPSDLMLALYAHLVAHPWAPAALAQRPPRGPAYLALSERLAVLVSTTGAADPLAVSYALSNLTVGSAMTAAAAAREPETAVPGNTAPRYAELHRARRGRPEEVLEAGLRAILTGMSTQRAAR